MKIETMTVKLKVKLSLWSAIKLRIAGIKNITDEVGFDDSEEK